MLIRELIEELQKCNPEAEVHIGIVGMGPETESDAGYVCDIIDVVDVRTDMYDEWINQEGTDEGYEWARNIEPNSVFMILSEGDEIYKLGGSK